MYCLRSRKQNCYMGLVTYNNKLFLSKADLETNNISNLFVTSEKLLPTDIPEYDLDMYGKLEYTSLQNPKNQVIENFDKDVFLEKTKQLSLMIDNLHFELNGHVSPISVIACKNITAECLSTLNTIYHQIKEIEEYL